MDEFSAMMAGIVITYSEPLSVTHGHVLELHHKARQDPSQQGLCDSTSCVHGCCKLFYFIPTGDCKSLQKRPIFSHMHLYTECVVASPRHLFGGF